MKSRDGVVLLLALICILALEVTAVGLHFATLQELRTSRSAARALDLRIAAQSAAARVLAAWPAEQASILAAHTSMLVPSAGVTTATGIRSAAHVERLSGQLFLVRAEATSPLGEMSRVGVLVASTTPAALAGTVRSAVRADGLVRLVGGARIIDHEPGCAAPPGNALELSTSGSLDAAGGTITGAAVSSVATAGLLGTLDRDRLAAVARTPDSSANPLRFVPGDTTVATLVGTGVLVIAGNAEIRGGRFDGIIVVLGNLAVSGDAVISGALITRGGSVVLDHASVIFDACAIAAAASNPRLLGPYRPHGRMWVPLF